MVNPELTASDRFWTHVPAWSAIDQVQFLSPKWQLDNSIRSPQDLSNTLGQVVSSEFLADFAAGVRLSRMSVRVTPYTLCRIDWRVPESDPVRRQFIPLASEMMEDNPACFGDSLGETQNMAAPGLVWRYPDRALLLVTPICPTYCRFCTRAYAVGPDTQAGPKLEAKSLFPAWDQAIEFIRGHPAIRDVVVSGGDALSIPAGRLGTLLESIINLPTIRRVRVATKGLAVLPSKFTAGDEWFGTLCSVAETARRRRVELAIHTHINHSNEFSWVTTLAAQSLWDAGIVVRNQAVLLRGVNDSLDEMSKLIHMLTDINIQPYYVYVHDMVPSCEHLRTSIHTACELEKQVRGRVAGYLCPTFVVDLPGGGGKRDVHSFESYDRAKGIAEYRSPAVDPNAVYRFLDPLHSIPACS